jgi:hypothetical protein
VPFSAKTGQALARYLRVRANATWPKHECLWLAEKGKGPLTANGIKLMPRRRGKAAGVKDEIGRNLHAHLGRHGVAHEWQAAGGSEGDLMRIMGWRSPQMARSYGASAANQRAKDQAAARPVELLARTGRHHVGMFDRRRMRSGHDQSRDVGDVREQQRAGGALAVAKIEPMSDETAKVESWRVG